MKQHLSLLFMLLVMGITAQFAYAAAPLKKAEVSVSKHNLSADYDLDASGTTTNRVCVFCHTPHGANPDASYKMPLWNRELSGETYIKYGQTSTEGDTLQGTSLTAGLLEQPGGSSKLCLSCHDGTIAIGKLNVFNAGTGGTSTVGNATIADAGTDTGFTRNIGINLQNDHPISFTYATAYDAEIVAATADNLRPHGVGQNIDNVVPGTSSPLIPLESGQVQCTSCHDPHVVADDNTSVKFIRDGLNRFQENTGPSSDTIFDAANDIICLGCHKKAGWSQSSHAVSAVEYTTDAATLRDFPTVPAMPVYKAACLNCHDTHTVQGARKLLREGTDDTTNPKSGGDPAQEETCYQCHSSTGGLNAALTLTGQGNATFVVPNVKSDFTSTYYMPITNSDQGVTLEQHAITDGDFNESTTQLAQRHAECTDCHNPHRVFKSQVFNTNDGSGIGTHEHEGATAHSNIASGVLAGTTGVEPEYNGDGTWGQSEADISFAEKSGVGTGILASDSHVTREYQICLKCHSNNAWTNTDVSTSRPLLKSGAGGGSAGVNGVNNVTNQAMEFQPASNGSWHPVIAPTGLTPVARTVDYTNNWIAPFNAAVGTQTMYCSDCHGSSTANGTADPDGAGVENGAPWGPHGSNNPFILKGSWSATSGEGTTDAICFKCHEYDSYANAAPATVTQSGFSGTGAGCAMGNVGTNLHVGHAALGVVGNLQCTYCHVAVPHGWQNKALLVDRSSDLYPGTTTKMMDRADADEVGCDLGTTAGGCTVEPYYLGAQLGGGGAVNWQTSGNWTSGDCGQNNGNWMWVGGQFGNSGCPY